MFDGHYTEKMCFSVADTIYETSTPSSRQNLATPLLNSNLKLQTVCILSSSWCYETAPDAR